MMPRLTSLPPPRESHGSSHRALLLPPTPVTVSPSPAPVSPAATVDDNVDSNGSAPSSSLPVPSFAHRVSSPVARRPAPVARPAPENQNEEQEVEVEVEAGHLFPSERSLGRPLAVGDIVWAREPHRAGGRWWPAVVVDPRSLLHYDRGNSLTRPLRRYIRSSRPRRSQRANYRLVHFLKTEGGPEENSVAWIARCKLTPYSDAEARLNFGPVANRGSSGRGRGSQSQRQRQRGNFPAINAFIHAVVEADKLLGRRQRRGRQIPVEVEDN